MASVAQFQEGPEVATYLQPFQLMRQHSVDASRSSSSLSRADELMTTKVRKPYTITKQRERWEDEEHQKFIEALKLYGRAWRRIEEHIGTKTAVQIRSHAQKFFSKLEREASMGGAAEKDIEIPPPRPKRKPSHPYPRKATITLQSKQSAMEDRTKVPSAMFSVLTYPGRMSMHSQASTFPSHVEPKKDVSYPQGLFLGPSQSNKSQTSLKLFGQTVLIDSNRDLSEPGHKRSRLTDTSDATREGFPFQNNGEHKDELSLCVKGTDELTTKSNGNLKAVTLEMGCVEPGNSALEGSDESNVEDPCEGKVRQPQQAITSASSRMPQQQRAFPLKAGGSQTKEDCVQDRVNKIPATTKLDMKMPDAATCQWMENYLRHQAISSKSRENFTSLTLAPCQFPQGKGMHHPAASYASAMAVMGHHGLMPGVQILAAPEQKGTNAPAFCSDSRATLAAAASAWWALQGAMKPGLVFPNAGDEHVSTHVPDGVNVTVSGRPSSRQPQNISDSKPEHVKNKEVQSIGFPSIQDGLSKLMTCYSKSSILPADESNKEIRERSSTGSNTHLPGHPDIPNSPGSDLSRSSICPQKKRNASDIPKGSSCSFSSKDNVNGSSRILKVEQTLGEVQQSTSESIERHDVILNANSCPKVRFKNVEKHQYRNVQSLDEEERSKKPHKSYAYEAEKWKEFSKEGRKAFQVSVYKDHPGSADCPQSLEKFNTIPGLERQMLMQPNNLMEKPIKTLGIEKSRDRNNRNDVLSQAGCPLSQELEMQEEELRSGGEMPVLNS